jgi:hypothetical protein
MLVIVSDIHLGDGTCGKSISPTAFALFSERLRELAYHASFRGDGHYKPVEKIDLVLMGDILDPLHSSLWLDTKPGDPDYIRPWSNPSNPWYTAKLQQVTRAILKENQMSVATLKRIASEEIIRLPPAVNGLPDFDSRERVPPRVNIHYMIGNHDWFYHLPGPGFDAIRQEMIDALGLSNPVDNFPWEISEHEPLQDVFARYKVYGQHGDKYDRFNYDRERGRDFSTLGDVFSVEVLNRYPVAVAEQFGSELPLAIVDSLRMLTNVRPALATSLWITGQIRQHAGNDALEHKLKKIWDQITDEFLQVDFVREADKAFQFDIVDALELVVNISKQASFKTINELTMWIRDKMWEGEISYANHALREKAFLDNSARYIVYGHTHHHETIPLDAEGEPPYEESQIYFNSGTWRSYYDLAVRNPGAQKFVPYQSMTYLTFYDCEERGERHFEAWTGAFV